MAAACGADLAATSIAGDAPLRAAAATAGQLVVTTPAKLAQVLREGILTQRMLQDRLQVRAAPAGSSTYVRGCQVSAPATTAAPCVGAGVPTLPRPHQAGSLQPCSGPPRLLAPLLSNPIPSPPPLAHHTQVLVLDEADLLLSYGYEEDVQALAPQIPRSCQCLLMSATSSEDVDRLTKLVLHNPLTLSLLGAATGQVRARAGAGGRVYKGTRQKAQHVVRNSHRKTLE